ncbi:unnamed protein product [Sphagnum balticum]
MTVQWFFFSLIKACAALSCWLVSIYNGVQTMFSMCCIFILFFPMVSPDTIGSCHGHEGFEDYHSALGLSRQNTTITSIHTERN